MEGSTEFIVISPILHVSNSIVHRDMNFDDINGKKIYVMYYIKMSSYKNIYNIVLYSFTHHLITINVV